MDALIGQQSRLGAFYPLCVVAKWPAPHRAAFYEQLDRWPDEDVIQALHPVAEGIGQELAREEAIEGYRFETPFSAEAFVADMAPLAQKAENQLVRQTAQELLSFVRRRFAKQLAEAEKAKAEALKKIWDEKGWK
jgi:hypothetical protein